VACTSARDGEARDDRGQHEDALTKAINHERLARIVARCGTGGAIRVPVLEFAAEGLVSVFKFSGFIVFRLND